MSQKEYRALRSMLYTDIRQERKQESCQCPYCGGKMTIQPGSRINTVWKDREYMVCNNYPVCDTYCRVEMHNGNYQMVSTPANKELRMLRKEAHFWVDKLVETGVCHNLTDAFYITSQKVSICNGKRIHIGQCREHVCLEIITACINTLYQNKNRLNKFAGWKGSAVKDHATLNQMKELVY